MTCTEVRACAVFVTRYGLASSSLRSSLCLTFSEASSPSAILAEGRQLNMSTPEINVVETSWSSWASSQRKESAEMDLRASSPRSLVLVPAVSEKRDTRW